MIWSFLSVLFFSILVSSQGDPKVGEWPEQFYSWLVSSYITPGQSRPIINIGQMIVYDYVNKFSGRFKEQDLNKPQNSKRPVNYCTQNMHYTIDDGSGATPYDKVMCTRKDSYTFEKLAWPEEFESQYQFIGTNPVNMKICNHFFAPAVTVNGFNYQVDVWTGQADGNLCQISMRDLDSNNITNVAFDGFQRGYPSEALVSTTAAIKCARNDWVCSLKKNVSVPLIMSALRWVCSDGKVNCAPINKGGANFYPDTPQAHGNWAFNAYYQKEKFPGGATSCNFNGICELIPPSPLVGPHPLPLIRRTRSVLEAFGQLNVVCD